MATHSSILAWTIPWTEEPGGIQPMGRRVVHDRSDLACKQTASLWPSVIHVRSLFPHVLLTPLTVSLRKDHT